MKAAFLDRDGTIISDYPDEEWKEICTPNFLEGSIEGIRKLVDLKYEIIIITNQYLINDGIISVNDYEIFTQKILNKLSKENINILDIFYCPHSKKENCNCCKPQPGMIEKALLKYPQIDIYKSIVIGDSICDSKLANHFNMKFYGISGGNLVNGVNLYNSILEVAMHIDATKNLS